MKHLYLCFCLFLGNIPAIFSQCGGSPSFTISSPRCVGQPINFINNSPAGADTTIWKFGAGIPSIQPGNVSSSYSYSTTGTYNVTLIRVFNGCRDSITQSITINPNPTAAFTFSPGNACSGSTISFNNTSSGAVSYSWNFGDPGSSNTSSLPNTSHVFDAVGGGTQNYTVTLGATSAAGCTSSSSQTITIRQRPDATLEDAAGANFAACDVGEMTLNVNNASSTFSTNSNYQINWGNGQADYNAPNFISASSVYPNQGNFIIAFTVTGDNGCVSSQNFSGFNGSNPSISLGNPGGTNNLCGPTTLSFPVNNTENNPPGTTYTVTTNDGTGAIVYNHPPPAFIVHTFNESSCGKTSLGGSNNAFHIRVVASNPCGESAVTVEPIRVSTKPDIDFTVPPNICVGSSYTFTSTVIGGQNITQPGNVCSNTVVTKSWSINPATGWSTASNLSNSMTANVNFTQEGTYTIRFIGGTPCGNDTATKIVCVVGPPAPNFTITPDVACTPLNATVINTSAALTDCSPATYTWSVTKIQTGCAAVSPAWAFMNGTSATSINPQFLFSETGRYRVTLTATNVCGVFTRLDTVRVKSLPMASINNIPATCGDATISPVAVVNNCLSETAPIYQWTFLGATPASSSLTSPTGIYYNTPGNYTVRLDVTNECGTVNAMVPVTVRPLPLVDAGPDVVVCQGSVVQIGTPAAPGNTSHTWSPITNISPTNTAQANVTGINSTGVAIDRTYTLTVSNGTCTNTDQVVVTTNPQPPIPTVTNATICSGQTAILSVTGSGIIQWYTALAGGLPFHTGSSYTTPVLTASQTFYVNHIVNGCTTLTRVPVTATVNQNPIVNAGPDIQLCNQPIAQQLTGTPAGGSWSGPNIATGGVFTPTGTGIFNVVYTFTNPNGCTKADTARVTVINSTPAIAGSDINICVGQPSFSLSATPSGGTWSGSASVTPAGVFNPNVANTHTLVYTAGTSTCITRDTLVVSVYALPVVDAGAAQAVCRDLPAFPLAGQTPVGGSWTGTGITNPSGIFDAGVANTGNNALLYSYTDSNSCTRTATKNITVNPLPIVNVGADVQLCNQPIAQQLTGTPAGGSWSGPNITIGGMFTPTSTGIFSVAYTYTSPSGCTKADTALVTVSSPTPANAGNDVFICVGQPSFVLSATPSGGTWSGSASVTSAGVFNPNVANAHTLVYTVGTSTCITRDTLVVRVNALPVVNAGAAQAVCRDLPAFPLTGQTPLGGTWTGTGITNPSGIFDASVANTGNNTLVYSYTDSNGCTRTATKNITVNPLPIVNAGADVQLCNQPIAQQLTATPVGGSWTGSNITTGGMFTPTGNGIFDAIYIYTNLNGCTKTDTIRVSVIDPTLANAGNDIDVCIGQPVLNLSAMPAGGTWSGSALVSTSGTFTPSAVGNYSLVYSVGISTCATKDTILITVNALPLVNAGLAESLCVNVPAFSLSGNTPAGGIWSGFGITDTVGIFNASVANTGNNVLTYSYTDGNGCVNTSTKNITVNPLPVVNVGSDQTMCNQPISVQLNGTPTTGTWSGPNITSGGLYTPAGIGIFNLVYSYTDGNTCMNRDSLQITVTNPVQAVVGNDTSVCVGQVAFNLMNSPIGGTWSGSASVTSAGLFTPSTAGTYSLIYAYGAGTCLTTDQITITVHALPIVNAGADFSVCIDVPASALTGNTPAGGLWGGTGITNSNTGMFNPLIATSGNWNITYTFTDHNLCTNSDVRVINVNPLPIPNFMVDTLVCTNSVVPFSNTSTGATTYTWNFGDGGQASTTNTAHIYTAEDYYSVELMASTGFGCVDSIEKVVHAINAPNAQFITDITFGCGPLAIDFTNQSIGTYLNYAWDFGNGITSNAFDPGSVIFSPSTFADTVYSITLTTTNLCGSDIFDVDVTVNSTPTAIFGTNLTQGCSPFNVLFTNTSTGLPTSIFWDFGDGSTSNSFNPVSHTFSTGSNDTTYTVMMVAQNGCGSDTTYFDILVLPNTAISFFNTNPTQGCAPLTVNFTNFSSGVNTYEWFFGDGNISNQPTVSHTYINPGIYTAVLAVNNGCSFDTSEVTITVFEAPNLAFMPSTNNICGNLPVTFNNTSTGVSNSQWNFGDGNTSTLFSPTHTFTSTGIYTVSLSAVSTTNGCIDTITSTVTILSTPGLNISLPAGLACAPYTAQFINNSIDTDFYSWTFGDGNTGIGANTSHTYTNPGTYNIIVVGQNNTGCTDTATVILTLYQGPDASFVLPFVSVCTSPTVINILNTSSGAIGYDWDLGNTQSSTDNNPSATYDTTGTYTITLVASNQLGCVDSTKQTFNVYDKPTAILGANISACDGEQIVFTNNSINATSYTWNFGDGSSSSAETPIHTYGLTGTYDVTLVVGNAFGCSDTAYVGNMVSIFPNPTAGFTVNPNAITTGSPLVTLTSQSTGSSECVYYFMTGETLTDCDAQLIFSNIDAGGYEVMQVVSNTFGCRDTAIQKFIVLNTSTVFVPNSFTPDADGENDVFYAKGIGIKSFLLMIFNRWGEVVHTSENIETGWNGNDISGKPVKQDVYLWKIIARDINDELIKMNGHVTVIH